MSISTEIETRINDLNRERGTMMITAEAQARAMQAAFIADAMHDATAFVGRTVRNLATRLVDAYQRRQTLSYLRRLDDRLLADIGLNRAMLDAQLAGRESRLPVADVTTAEAPNAPVVAQDNRPSRRRAA